jgi:hypothetical protein
LYGIADSLELLFISLPAAGVSSLLLDASGKDGENFPLLVKAAFDFGDLGDFVEEFLNRFEYKHIVLLRDDSSGFFSLLSKNLFHEFKTDSHNLHAGTVEIPFTSATATSEDYQKVLNDAKERARGQVRVDKFSSNLIKFLEFQ